MLSEHLLTDGHDKTHPGETTSCCEPGNVTCWSSKLMVYNHHRNDISRVNLKWYKRTQRTAVSPCHHWYVLSAVDTGKRIVLFLTAGKQARGSARCGERGKRRPASERAELFCSSPPTSASCCIVDQQSSAHHARIVKGKYPAYYHNRLGTSARILRT